MPCGVKQRTGKQSERGICIRCEKNLQRIMRRNKKGLYIYDLICNSCHSRRIGRNVGGSVKMLNHRKWKNDHCEKCGFIPVHPCQLDLDHIDGNRNNNHPSNHQTLCANCHRLKTYEHKNFNKIDRSRSKVA